MDWSLYAGQKVQVYRNLENLDVLKLSVRAYIQSPTAKSRSWLVVGHVFEIALTDVCFKISLGLQGRARAEGRRNVHAWAEGILVGQSDRSANADIPLGYDPFKDKFFVERYSRQPIRDRCNYFIARNNGVFISDDALLHPPGKPEFEQLSLFDLMAA